MIRTEQERRNAEEQREYLRSSLEDISSGEQTEVSEAVASTLITQIHNMERELAEYEELKEGLRSTFEVGNLDEFGEVVTKARIARGWSQADLARVLGIKPQQVQRYERNDWQKISFWRLQEVVEALDLGVAIHAQLHDQEDQDIEPLRVVPSYGGLYHGSASNRDLGGIEQTPSSFIVTTHNAPQTMLEGDWGVSGDPQEPRFLRLRTRTDVPAMTSIPTVPVWRKPESRERLKEMHARSAPDRL